ncbi:MAG TPA: pyridoxal phosphate-dependent aminotransferase [Gammaproteobacteria bacterium]|nr:pyridoxal phosphate-dependent aminotransferase [Gammaproteobacteria bacterium]
MAIRLSDRVGRIKPSATLAISQRAQNLKTQGKDIVDMGTGEPDFDTPSHIKEAAIQAMRDGKTKYTAVDGISSLKEAILMKFANFNGLNFSADQVMVSSGGKQCIYNLFQSTLNSGDEVIIPIPYWVSYPDIAILAQATPVFIETTMQTRFKLTPAQLDNAITSKTKLLILNSPSNPTGIAYTENELKLLGEVLLKHPNVFVATDDMYEHILWTEKGFCNILNTTPELYDRVVVLNGVSKAYAMTGWRIGYCAGPSHVIKAMKNLQSQSTSNPCSIAQAAAEAAIRGPLDLVAMMVKSFKERHDYLVSALNNISGIKCASADGTFYVFPNVQQAIEKIGIASDTEFADHLLSTVGLAVVPGSAFGAPGHLRLSVATSMDTLEKAVDRLNKALM